jgi:WhiB family redox-sensing transcriptional regulator
MDRQDKLRGEFVTAQPAATREAARRALHRLARDPADETLLLDALGLLGPEPHVVRPTERVDTPAARPEPHTAPLTTKAASGGRGQRTLPVVDERPVDDEGPDWRQSARCRDEDPELFFPAGNSGPALLQADKAKTVCYLCPVMESCRRWALTTWPEFGVFGGMNEQERSVLKRRRNRQTSTR